MVSQSFSSSLALPLSLPRSLALSVWRLALRVARNSEEQTPRRNKPCFPLPALYTRAGPPEVSPFLISALPGGQHQHVPTLGGVHAVGGGGVGVDGGGEEPFNASGDARVWLGRRQEFGCVTLPLALPNPNIGNILPRSMYPGTIICRSILALPTR